MKLATSLVLATYGTLSASFSVFPETPLRAGAATLPQRCAPTFAESAPLEVVSGDESSDPYERIGINKDQLAIGIDAEELLEWVGTKQQLVDKFLRDNKNMDEDRAVKEVEKFYMDSEMVNAYIKFEKDKVLNPPNYRAEAEQTLSDPKTIATYAAWLVGGASFGWIRKSVIEPKYASGEWEEIHVQLPTLPWMEEAAANAVDASSSVVPDAVSSAADIGSSVADAVSSSL